MQEKKAKTEAVCALIESVNPAIAREVTSILSSYRGGVEEIRLRGEGMCSLVIFGREYPLYSSVSCEELWRLLSLVCSGSMYAYRDSIAEGFVTMDGGIRVGVSGRAGYEMGRNVGVGDFTGLCFRIPSSDCTFGVELYEAWRNNGCKGMLIASPPSGGKTTALRSLARFIGGGSRPMRVTVVDERLEFDTSAYRNSSVDILRGYKRSLGVEIAVRTLSAEVIIVDEIYSQSDRDAISFAHGSGVSVIATVHAGCMSELKKRDGVRGLLDDGMFPSVAFIERTDGHFGFRMERYA